MHLGIVISMKNFMGRIDSLRHHDQRRDLLKRGLDQPVVMDDFADSNSHAVRNLFLDPDAPNPAPSPVQVEQDRSQA